MATGKTYILSGLYDGKPYNALNDVSIDEQGRIYFSDPRYLGHEPIFQSGYSVYRLDPDGSVTRIVTDGGKTNGVLVSPDQKTLYVISNDNGYFDFQRLKEGETTAQGRHVLQAYDIAADGSVSNRRVMVDYHPYSGPDSSGGSPHFVHSSRWGWPFTMWPRNSSGKRRPSTKLPRSSARCAIGRPMIPPGQNSAVAPMFDSAR
jgi:hypothetical protein